MPVIEYSAIPTVYKSVAYRSRLEARFACLLDQHGLLFDYEPIDLDFYTPDFIVEFPFGATLVECKPAVTAPEFRPACRKITRSGWLGPAIVVGSRLCTASDGTSDLTMMGSTHAELGGWSRVGRGRWPRPWGECPFEDVWQRWHEAGRLTQWNPRSG